MIKSNVSEVPISVQSEVYTLKSTPEDNCGSNLIVNGDFESDPNLFGLWEAYSDHEQGIATFTWNDLFYHGNSGYSLQIEGTAIDAFLCNMIPIEPNKSYSFSACGKAFSVIKGENELGLFIYSAEKIYDCCSCR